MYASGLPGMAHTATLPNDGFMGNHHMSVIATHVDEAGADACPGVTLYARSCPETRAMFPHDWEMTYQVSSHGGNGGSGRRSWGTACASLPCTRWCRRSGPWPGLATFVS
jgi:hypothetical protein